MKTLRTNHRLKSLFLLALYLMMLSTSVLHIHASEGEEMACQDCLEHVKHHGHISQSSVMDIDCVLCKVIHSTYTTPEVQTLSATVLLLFAFTMPASPDAVHRMVAVPSLRAPPVI